MTDKKLTTSKVKKHNQHLIYKLIYEEKEIARQEIATKLNLSLPTVNQSLKVLMERGIIEYAGNFQSTGGRKAQVIIPINNAKIAVGVDIRKKEVRILLVDLYGTILDYKKSSLLFTMGEEYGKQLNGLIEELVSANKIEKESLLGVGISFPGVLNKDSSQLQYAPSLDLNDYPLKMLTEQIDYPCVIENDANAGAFTEIWNRAKKEPSIYITVEKGVGGCIILGNEILKGADNRAGEFGHMTLYPGGRTCSCGEKGCLEAYISTARLSEDLNIELEDFFAGIEQGNQEYQAIWEDYLHHLCLGINNIYTAFNTKVILAGHLTPYLVPYLSDIRIKLKELYSFAGEEDVTYLQLTNYYTKAIAVGAALQWIHKYIESI